MKRKTAIINRVADLLCHERAREADFFEKLADALTKRGYDLEAHQKGIHGTYICITKRRKIDVHPTNI